ncbi:MAG: glycosyltransferase family 4 protein [Kiritimatiellales bacterium]
MKILQVHNYYQQAGGEDAVVAAELALLRERGHEVITYYKNNSGIVDRCSSPVDGGESGGQQSGLAMRHALGLLSVAFKTVWNRKTYREFRKLLHKEQPDVVHCHNTFPLVSPSIYWACAHAKVPVVQTLHNYRLLCLNAFLFRTTKRRHKTERTGSISLIPGSHQPSLDSSICEACLTKAFKWPGVRYSCYRGSKAGSLVVAMMLFTHKLLGTWTKKITAYIVLTEFQKQKMIEGGLPADKVLVKPNFIQVPGTGEPARAAVKAAAADEVPGREPQSTSLIFNALDRYALFVGRLSREKGVRILVRAWEMFQKTHCSSTHTGETSRHVRLVIAGDGPERDVLQGYMKEYGLESSILFAGKLPNQEVQQLMKQAEFLIFSSVWHETFGLTLIEAGINATPAIVADPTVTSSLVQDGKTGVFFSLGDEKNLADKIAWAFNHSDEMKKMGERAKEDFEQKYSAEVNYQQLIEIYKTVVKL